MQEWSAADASRAKAEAQAVLAISSGVREPPLLFKYRQVARQW